MEGGNSRGGRPRLLNLAKRRMVMEEADDGNSPTATVESPIPLSSSSKSLSPSSSSSEGAVVVPDWIRPLSQYQVNQRPHKPQPQNSISDKEFRGDDTEDHSESKGDEWDAPVIRGPIRSVYGKGSDELDLENEDNDDDNVRENNILPLYYSNSNHNYKNIRNRLTSFLPEEVVARRYGAEQPINLQGAHKPTRFHPYSRTLLNSDDGNVKVGFRGNVRRPSFGPVVRNEHEQTQFQPQPSSAIWTGRSYFPLPAGGFIRGEKFRDCNGILQN